MEDVIRFENISKHFGGVHALTDVSFGIEKGKVHALLGENGAGKSTLMNILSGVITQDNGQILYKGEATKIGTPHAAKALGIATVYQELKNCDNLTVTENIFLGREESRCGVPNWKKMNAKAAAMMERYGLDFDVRTPLSKLTVAQKQMIEIAKAMDLHADVLILDEPTSALTINETEKLFDNIRTLKSQGVTIIYITHRLEEIYEICDCVSMMRNGHYLGTSNIEDITREEIIRTIAGKELQHQYASNEKKSFDYEHDEVILSVRNLASAPLVKDVSFDLYKGEILGFYGLQGSGRTETMETIFGLRKKTGGTITIFGKEVTSGNVKKSISSGIGMITEERKRDGVFFNMDINDNIAAIHDRDITRGLSLNTRLVNRITEKYIDTLSIKCTGIHQLIGDLSGGNQQKVVISRCLSMDPEILILDEPTRGVDVGAKAEIYEILRSLRENEKKSMIIVSSELPEIILLCDRVVVMNSGGVAGTVSGEDITSEKILQRAFNEE